MRAKYINYISIVLSFIFIFRICFLSLDLIGFSAISAHHSINSKEKTVANTVLEINIKVGAGQLINNINSVLHFFKNRIVENKRLLLFILFFLIIILAFKTSPILNNVNILRFRTRMFFSSKKLLSFSILRI
ncbi:MAG: hypothetical protein ABI388_04515 [Bacteroidia bacterium]